MADRREHQDPDLERELRELGDRLEYPTTPDVTESVLRRLQEDSPGGGRYSPLSSRLLRTVAATLLIVLFTVLLLSFSPSVRTAVADWLGVAGIKISFLPQTPKPQPASVGSSLKLGKHLSLSEAQRRVPFEIIVPNIPELREPDAVYLRERSVGNQIYLVYRARPGLPRAAETGVGVLITELQVSTDMQWYAKLLGPNAQLEKLEVNGGHGVWIKEAPRVFVYQDPNGRVIEEKVRMAANTLIWEQGDLTLRLEGNIAKARALRIAESMR